MKKRGAKLICLFSMQMVVVQRDSERCVSYLRSQLLPAVGATASDVNTFIAQLAAAGDSVKRFKKTLLSFLQEMRRKQSN